MVYTYTPENKPRNLKITYTNQKENHLNQTIHLHDFGFQPLIFQGVPSSLLLVRPFKEGSKCAMVKVVALFWGWETSHL